VFDIQTHGPTGGEGMQMTKEIIQVLALADEVVIGENDPDPRVREETRKLAERRAKEIGGNLFFPPDEYKDGDEWILSTQLSVELIKNLYLL
jgi:hypothetical protein